MADDLLRRFTDGAGELSLALTEDIWALLSLHDMSHLDMGEEASSLHKANDFSSKHLASAIRYLNPGLARYVRQSLDHPYHMSLMQYKARHHLCYMQSLPNRKSTAAMEELATAEFHFNKLLHQKEMEEVKRYIITSHPCQENDGLTDMICNFVAMVYWMKSVTQMVDGPRIGPRSNGGPGPGAEMVHVVHDNHPGIFLLQIPGSVDKDNLSYLCCG